MCLTSFKAREALRNLKTTDPAFWAELTVNQPDENLPGMEETLPEDVEPDTGLEDADADDSDLSMPTLISALTRDIPETVGSRKTGTLMSLSDAENVDLDPELVPPAEANVEAPKEEKAPEGSGRGKRKKFANKLYKGDAFWRHNDNDDWKDDSLLTDR